VIDAVEAVRAGHAGPDTIRIAYVEEQPLDRTVRIEVGRDGRVTVETRTLKPDCPQAASKTCWSESVRSSSLTAEAHRKLVATIPAHALEHLPHEEAVAPGMPRVAVTIDADGGARLASQCGLTATNASAEFGRFRDAMLAFARVP